MKSTATTTDAGAMVKRLLVGLHIDHLIITSSVIVVVLTEFPVATDRPSTIWLQFLCDANLTQADSSALYRSDDLGERSELVKRFYRLIGFEIADAAVRGDGALVLTVDSTVVDLVPCGDTDQIEWLAASDYPDIFETAEWMVGIDEDGAAVVRSPS